MADQAPAIRAFQFDAGGFTGAIRKSVNLFRGSVNLPLPILQMPGRNGISASITAMYSGVSPEQATRWNMDAPTSILGLGWDIPVEQITVQYRPGTASDAGAEYFLHSGGQAYSLLASGPAEFITREYNFWRIRYDRGSQSWTVIRDDGTIWKYGGDGAEGRFVDYGVRWQQWRDSSTQTGCTTMSVAWKLRRIQSMWDDTIEFSYRFQDKLIGSTGLSYTQASYLAEITDCFDRTLTFHYAPKEYNDKVQEYMPAHAAEGDSWAYQDSFGTEYLTGISVAAEDEPQFTVLLESSIRDFSGTGKPGMFKRTLDSVCLRYPNRAPEAGFTFTYLESGTPSAGLLAGISYPQGAVVTYNYGELMLGNALIKQPIESAPGEPRVWFGADYAVFSFQNDSSLTLRVYSWLGGWFASGEFAMAAASPSVNDLRVECGRGFFVAYYKGLKAAGPQNGSVFAQSVYRPDEWTQQPLAFTVAKIAVGNDCFVAQSVQSSSVKVFSVINGQVQFGPTFQMESSKLGLAGTGQNFAVMAWDSSAKIAYMRLLVKDQDGHWSGLSVPGVLQDIYWEDWVEETFWSVGSTFASATWVKADLSSYSVAALNWSDSAMPRWTVLGEYPVPQSGKLPFTTSPASGSIIGNCQHVWRWDGAGWKAADIGPVLEAVEGDTAAEFSYFADAAVMSARQGGSSVYTLITYDPHSNSWNSPVQIGMSGAKPHAPFAATIGSSYLTIGKQLFHADPAGEWSPVNAGVIGGSVNLDSVTNVAPQYILSEDEDGLNSNLVVLRNGGCVAHGGSSWMSLPGQRCYVPRDSGDSSGCFMGGGSQFVTYSAGRPFGPGTAMVLYRVVDPSFDANKAYQTASVVKGVSIDDGVSVMTTAYDYTEQTMSNGMILAQGACYGQNSPIPQFSRVSIREGVDARGGAPNGSRVQYFLNGVRPATEGVFYPFNGPFTNCRSYYAALNGMLLYERSNDSDGTPVQVSLSFWNVTERPLARGSAAYPTSPRKIVVADAVSVCRMDSTPEMISQLNGGQLPQAIRAGLAEAAMEPAAEVDGYAIETGGDWLFLDDQNDHAFFIMNDGGVFQVVAGWRATHDTVFNASNGKPSRQTVTNCDVNGRLTRTTSATTYLCDVWPGAADLNLLSPVVQTELWSAPLSDPDDRQYQCFAVVAMGAVRNRRMESRPGICRGFQETGSAHGIHMEGAGQSAGVRCVEDGQAGSGCMAVRERYRIAFFLRTAARTHQYRRQSVFARVSAERDSADCPDR